ncbi:monovalent cation/H+ antiporter complex subunit F [Halobaculum marinum]|uniref:Monovalent cation/H+ antiporter complex subunit F n=1 Tax=Halobaculum marinum TaxID=3031996 RepID=A0ABD5WX66_9EURY|nr:monovalent cation/H+ antiporter complex subunit F [Halobaculum sp. DT55]
MTPLLTAGLLAGATALLVLALALFARVARGPTPADRVIAVNVIGTATVVVIALVSAGLGEPGFLDVALVYALLNFLLSLGLSRFSVERGGLL